MVRPHSVRTLVTIAGIRFQMSGNLGTGHFLPYFTDFLSPALSSDFQCDIAVAGASEKLRRTPRNSANPWSFSFSDGACEVFRRSPDGDVWWHMRGNRDFSQVETTWSSQLFAERYGSYHEAWSTGLGLVYMAMRLRTIGGFPFHGAAADLDGHGIICTGLSGVGKSTISRLLNDAGIPVLTDERAILRRTSPDSDNFLACGSPWPSSAGLAANSQAPLRRIYLLAHGRENRLTTLLPAEAVRRLIPLIAIPWQSPALLDPFLATLDSLVRNVPCKLLEFRPEPDIVPFLRRDLA